MCGICGIVDFKRIIPNKSFLTKNMAQSLIHRGPDDEGYYNDQYIS